MKKSYLHKPAVFSQAERDQKRRDCREADARALASGEKSVQQIRRDNGLFSGLNLRPNYNAARKKY